MSDPCEEWDLIDEVSLASNSSHAVNDFKEENCHDEVVLKEEYAHTSSCCRLATYYHGSLEETKNDVFPNLPMENLNNVTVSTETKTELDILSCESMPIETNHREMNYEKCRSNLLRALSVHDLGLAKLKLVNTTLDFTIKYQFDMTSLLDVLQRMMYDMRLARMSEAIKKSIIVELLDIVSDTIQDICVSRKFRNWLSVDCIPIIDCFYKLAPDYFHAKPNTFAEWLQKKKTP